MAISFGGNETLETKSLFCQEILQRSSVKVTSKSVATHKIITIAMILMNLNSANKFWDRSPKDNFLKKSTCLIMAKSIHAIRPGLSGTVPDFDTLSRCPGNYEIVPEI